jgi:hypothetical protein
MANKNKKTAPKSGRSSNKSMTVKRNPSTSTLPAGGIRVSHSEVIGSVSGGASTAIRLLFDIDPGNADSFPWLSTVATAYERYLFRSLRFEIISRTTENESGFTMAAVDYDGSDSYRLRVGEGVGSNQLGAMSDAVEGALYRDLTLVAKPERLHPRSVPKNVSTYMRAGDFTVSSAGTLYVATNGMTTDDLVALVRVTYVVDLLTPNVTTMGNGATNITAGETSDLNTFAQASGPLPTTDTETRLHPHTSRANSSYGPGVSDSEDSDGNFWWVLAKGIYNVFVDGEIDITGGDVLDFFLSLAPVALSLLPATFSDADVLALIDAHAHTPKTRATYRANMATDPDDRFQLSHAYTVVIDEDSILHPYIDVTSTSSTLFSHTIVVSELNLRLMPA